MIGTRRRPDLRRHARSRPGWTRDFKPASILEYWNGVPIDRAVQRYSEREVGGRPDSQRAWATQSLTLRALRFGPPPDEHWVRSATDDPGSRRSRHTRIDLADHRPQR